MRGVRSAGGLLALEVLGLTRVFHDVYGCSAGAVNASYFLAGQGAYGTTIYYQEINNSRFINYFRIRKVVDLDFLFDEVIARRKPLLVNKVMASPSRLFIAVTDVSNACGRVIHFQESGVPLTTLLKASSALPVVYNEPVLINGSRCVDGGIFNAIPLNNAIENGCTHILVLLTRPTAYRNPDPGWPERFLFSRTCGRNNNALCAMHLRGDSLTNSMRDLACGRTAPPAGVSIATLCPGPDDVPVERLTKDARLLKAAASKFAQTTLAAFGAPCDQMVELLQPHFRAETMRPGSVWVEPSSTG
jgi:predicted patatin/cPLA2 family phospholipase